MNTILRIFGILLLILAPLCLVAAGAYSYAQPRLYTAATEFRLLIPTVDGPKLSAAFESAKQKYSKIMERPLPTHVALHQTKAPDLYEISTIDADPSGASRAANSLTGSIHDSLRGEEEHRHVQILKIAEPAHVPTYPDVPSIMRIGTYSAVICGAIGAVLRW